MENVSPIRMRMRAEMLLIAVLAVAATTFDELGTASRAERMDRARRPLWVRLAQTGPLPTSIVNPRLGQPPNDSRLGPNGPTNFGPSTLAPIGPGTTVGPAGTGGVGPTDPSSRLGPMNGGNRLGVPPAGTAANPAIGGAGGAVGTAPGAVAPPAGSSVGAAPAAPAVGR